MISWLKPAATKRDSWAYSSELYAVGAVALTLFISAALLSHAINDHSWFYFDTTPHAPRNWCGWVGACISGLLYYLLGGAAILMIVVGGFTCYYLLTQKTIQDEWDRFVACGMILVCTSGLLALHAIDIAYCAVPGGFIGRIISRLAYGCLDYLGACLLLYTMLLCSIIVLLRISFISLLTTIYKKLSFRLIKEKLIKPVITITMRLSALLHAYTCKITALIKSKIKDHRKDESYAFDVTAFNQTHIDTLYDAQEWHELAPQKNHTAPKPEVKRVVAPEPVQKASAQEPVKNSMPVSAADVAQEYALPHLDIFVGVDEEQNDAALMQELEKRAAVLQEKLERFDVFGKVTAIKRGPVVTMFEYQPHIDTKISKIIALEDDLALALQATSIRIIAPIPGKSLVGFEVANKLRRGVMLSQLIKTDAYKDTQAALPMVVGVDTVGAPVIIDMARMPHLLMAGSTGSGKSVALNAMLISLLCKRSPDDLRLIIIDPKRLEFAPYADISHLLFSIVTDPKMAPPVLRWVVKQMEARYETMAKMGARNIYDFRANAEKNNYESMPFILIVIDELADLMMCAGKEVEDCIIRITQMARAAGIHLITATQRPSVDVITGLIKVNLPSRISFRVTSKIDSRTILDAAGADKLLGRGDMLFLDANESLLKRVHGAYVLDKEINQVIAHIKSQRPSDYLDIKQVCQEDKSAVESEQDEMYEEVCKFLQEIEEVSISLLQRRFRIGYNRSARIIDMLEAQGIIAPSYGGKTRKVIR
jgi:S-DNA-T family DNA segregation ATPase FtsK/SpoIIIE